MRVAVALVIGQALLCALIGYLTLGRSGAAGRSVDQMAEPPLAPPPTATSSYASPSASARSLSATATSRPTHRARDLTTTSTPAAPDPAPPVPPELPPDPLIGTSSPTPGPVTTATPPPVAGLIPPQPPAASPVTDVQDPVTIGDRCAPEWAFGRTADDTLVRCLRTGRHAPRWKIA
ncbi:hypothetical protein [Paractinoplanes durhamensis]|uniref:hypothetical protein n=1 Tax=Paractinoplanes durhamensis TaxID=113563 RepID=UPI00363259C2